MSVSSPSFIASTEGRSRSVSGEALSPDHETVPSRQAMTWSSLISVRAHFIPQMLQMANDM